MTVQEPAMHNIGEASLSPAFELVPKLTLLRATPSLCELGIFFLACCQCCGEAGAFSFSCDDSENEAAA